MTAIKCIDIEWDLEEGEEVQFMYFEETENMSNELPTEVVVTVDELDNFLWDLGEVDGFPGILTADDALIVGDFLELKYGIGVVTFDYQTIQ
jgi:hypothetical protein